MDGRHLGPEPEHPAAKRPRVRVRARERETEQGPRILDRVRLGDHAAHADADEVELGAVQVQVHDEGVAILRQHSGGVRPGRRGAGADAAVVEDEDGVPGGEEGGELGGPGELAVGEAVD